MRAPVEREAGKGGSRAEGPRMISQHPQRKGPGVLRPRANPPLEEGEETMGGSQSDPWRTVYHSDAAPQYPPLEGRGAAATESAPRAETVRERAGRTMECTIDWMPGTGMGFVAETGSGHLLTMDGAPD